MDLLFRERLNEIIAAVDAPIWRGRSGTTDLVIMREFLMIAALRGSLVFGMNLRSLAERAGFSLSTVWSSIRRLKARGFLKIACANRLPSQSTTYRLCCPRNVAFPNKEVQPPLHTLAEKHCSETQHSALDVGVAHDLWRGRRGLGKIRQRVYSILELPGQWTAAKLARATGYHRVSIYRILDVLAYYGLAEKNGRVWRRGPADIDDVARFLELDGAGDRQRRQHQLEREKFRAWQRDRIHVDQKTGEVRDGRIPDLVIEVWRRLGDRTGVPVPIIAEVRA